MASGAVSLRARVKPIAVRVHGSEMACMGDPIVPVDSGHSGEFGSLRVTSNLFIVLERRGR